MTARVRRRILILVLLFGAILALLPLQSIRSTRVLQVSPVNIPEPVTVTVTQTVSVDEQDTMIANQQQRIETLIAASRDRRPSSDSDSEQATALAFRPSWVLQLGVYSFAESKRLNLWLQQQGYASFVQKMTDSDAPSAEFHVRVGPYLRLSKAQAQAAELRKLDAKLAPEVVEYAPWHVDRNDA